MTPEQVLTVTMMLASVVLFAALLLSWADLGRTRHALAWASAYGIAVVQWCMLAIASTMADDHLLFAVAIGLAVAAPVLVFSGFRARARLPELLKPLLGLAVASAVLSFLLDRAGERGIAWALPQLIRTVLLPMAAFYVLTQPKTSMADRFAAATLICWGVVSFAIALCRIGGVDWNAPAPQFLAMVALPVVFTAAGFGTVMVLASDLAIDLRRLAVKDPLTNVLNRRGFDEAAATVIASESRRGGNVCLVLADIDHFKQLNDRHGHLVGDRALVKVASCLAAEIRRGDVIGRIGGEEFAILLAPCKGAMAQPIVERMRRSIEALDLGLPQGQRLTTSFGVVELERLAGFDKGLLRADEALYASKQAGRNRVTLAA